MLKMVSKTGKETTTGKDDKKPVTMTSAITKPAAISAMSKKIAQSTPAKTTTISKSGNASRAQVKTSLTPQEQEEQRKRIERLKAARPSNQASLAAKTPKKTTSASSRSDKTPKKASVTSSRKHNAVSTVSAPVSAAPTKAPVKKLNFREIMKQAEQVDSEKLKMKMKVKTHEKEKTSTGPQSSGRIPSTAAASRSRVGSTSIRSDPISRRPNNSTPITSASRKISEPISSASRAKKGLESAASSKILKKSEPISRKASSNSSSSRSGGTTSKTMKSESKPARPVSRTPAPLAQPMQKLMDKRKRKAEQTRQAYYDEDDESLDDFIVDDEEDDYGRDNRSRRYEDEDEGYDRDEIWKMFNRGKRRADFVIDNDDDSDMEATGAELFREEQRSLRVAREEDEAEERELKRRAEEKKRRKLRQQ